MRNFTIDISYKNPQTYFYQKLLQYPNEIEGEYQCGLKRDRSTIEHLFTILKNWEYNDVNQLYIDFVKAYDSIPGVAKLLDNQSHFSKFEIFREPQLNTYLKGIKKLQKLYLLQTYKYKYKICVLNLNIKKFNTFILLLLIIL